MNQSYYTQPSSFNDPGTDRVLGWEDEIENESSFVLLPEGEYTFTVTNIERGYYNGGEKIPACPQATVTLQIGTATLTERFLLHSRMEWKLSEFFGALGMKKHGERLRMQWNAVIGKSGRCKVLVRNYTKKDGTSGETNGVDHFIYAEDVTAQPQNVPPAVTSAPQTRGGAVPNRPWGQNTKGGF